MTWNEAHNIGRCLESVPFAAEKVVIDSGSSDDTVRIAESHGARVVHQPWLGFGPQRNFASTQAAHDLATMCSGCGETDCNHRDCDGHLYGDDERADLATRAA